MKHNEGQIYDAPRKFLALLPAIAKRERGLLKSAAPIRTRYELFALISSNSIKSKISKTVFYTHCMFIQRKVDSVT
jgi:hypothetical protein